MVIGLCLERLKRHNSVVIGIVGLKEIEKFIVPKLFRINTHFYI